MARATAAETAERLGHILWHEHVERELITTLPDLL